jgi:hypothetical protein
MIALLLCLCLCLAFLDAPPAPAPQTPDPSEGQQDMHPVWRLSTGREAGAWKDGSDMVLLRQILGRAAGSSALVTAAGASCA